MQLLIFLFSPTSSYIVSVRSDIFLSTIFTNTLTLCCSLDVRDQISRPFKITLYCVCVCVCVCVNTVSCGSKLIFTEFYRQIISVLLFILTQALCVLYGRYIRSETCVLNMNMHWMCGICPWGLKRLQIETGH
jgi:hypothetical protein